MILSSGSPFSRSLKPEMFKALNESIREGSGASSLFQLLLIVLIAIPIVILLIRVWGRDRGVRASRPRDHFSEALQLLPLSAMERQDLRALAQSGVTPEPLAALLSPQSFDLAVNALLLDAANSELRARFRALRGNLFGVDNVAPSQSDPSFG